MMTLPAIVPPPGVHDTNVLLLMCSVYVPFATGQYAFARPVTRGAPSVEQVADLVRGADRLPADLPQPPRRVPLRGTPHVDDRDRRAPGTEHRRGRAGGELLVLPVAQREPGPADLGQLQLELFPVGD